MRSVLTQECAAWWWRPWSDPVKQYYRAHDRVLAEWRQQTCAANGGWRTQLSPIDYLVALATGDNSTWHHKYQFVKFDTDIN